MADTFTRWDVDINGPGTYTSWDDVPGGPNETMWDLLPEVINRAFRYVIEAARSRFRVDQGRRRHRVV